MALSLSTPFRYTTPPPRKSVTGVTADVYAQLASDFGMERPSTFVVLSSVPELLTATWALMRESLIAGEGDRTGKELAALGVSLANRCPFCVDAHTMLLHATGDHSLAEAIARGETPSDEGHARVLAWGRASRTPGAPELTPFPFPAAHAPAYIGTALTFHFINRIASALLTENLLPGNAQRLRAVRSLGGRSLARTVRRRPAPGVGLTLLDAPGPGPDWARGTAVGPAFAALRDAATAGGGLLDAADRSLVRETLQGWDGSHPSLAWDGLPDRSRPGARLALLAALAPYRITDEDVTAWRDPSHSDRHLVRLVAYGAFAAVDRVERALPARVAKKPS
ncbi:MULTISPECIES: carboxymuconolactone decarboxylase family protein [unclassified Streptomyces]|uniref:carboxymuconolactone decarboxylase family protein n=1 Tax=unclassified Streptomyces TaxID=2593676 RepID=UPI00225C056B|nr:MULTISPECIES: carboxymuconolactone decarboxylase family protein [unclassified Streptomyces]MCX4987582.1 carboxymuconolactone decarboxylase family protein [Streptomyces sp. NBC_00568]MCX5007286.1 carboxymuconolactone decarboxylase family protein [Streptomyces sp. NBC_00638]